MKKNNTGIRWLYGCLIFFMFSCSDQPVYNKLNNTSIDTLKALARIQRTDTALQTLKKNIHTGDVVTRAGNDFTSESLRSLNQRDKTFSHCGIASIEHDSLFIYHALGGEWNPDQKLLRESFENFTSPADNTAAGIFRFNISEKINNKLIAVVQQYYHAGIKFDLDFDLKTDDKMYCAEFVYKSFLTASDSTINFSRSHINGFEFIGVDDIILDPHCVKIGFLNYRLY